MTQLKDFRIWLQKRKGLNSKQSTDVISRCKKVQSFLDRDLAETVKNEESALECIVEISRYFTPQYGPSWSTSAATHRKAFRLFAEFNNVELPTQIGSRRSKIDIYEYLKSKQQ